MQEAINRTLSQANFLIQPFNAFNAAVTKSFRILACIAKFQNYQRWITLAESRILYVCLSLFLFLSFSLSFSFSLSLSLRRRGNKTSLASLSLFSPALRGRPLSSLSFMVKSLGSLLSHSLSLDIKAAPASKHTSLETFKRRWCEATAAAADDNVARDQSASRFRQNQV